MVVVVAVVVVVVVVAVAAAAQAVAAALYTPPPPPPPPVSPVLYTVCTKGLTDLSSNGFIKTASDIHTLVTAVQEQLEKLEPRDRVQNHSKQGANPVVHSQQSSGTRNASCLLQWSSHRTHKQSEIPSGSTSTEC